MATTPGAVAAGTEVEDGRVHYAGKLPPMKIRKLPEPPEAAHIIGPAMILVALGVGFGETFLWPRLVIVFGPEIRWMFLVGVVVQTIVMLEMARYAMATGESIFFGAARIAKPLMWLFFAVAILVYIWPGHISNGAVAFETLTGIPWQLSATVALIVIGIMFTVVTYIYNLIESLLAFLVGVLVIGSAIVGAIVGSLSDLGQVLLGLFRFDVGFPAGTLSAQWFPLVVGALAFAGPSGMQQMWYTLWLRDKGAGMGVHIPRVRGLLHAEEEETIPEAGSMFDVDDPEEMRKWQGWRRWINYDALLLFFGTTMLVTIIFTVLAMNAAEVNPAARQALLEGEEEAALTAMGDAFGRAAGILDPLFFVFIAIIGFKASIGLFDAFARGQSDMTYYFMPGAKRFKMAQLYAMYLWFVIAFGLLILWFGPADGPTQILDVLAFLSTFVMGAYCLTLAVVNNRNLPKKIRPNPIFTVILVLGGLGYLGALFYSLIRFGVTDLG
ncbi:MAG: Nramp family divalent metal transporter [Actinomycetota bacterium]|nr:Nramp family divalent metal transporter [Actinomycetota bacterium]MDP9481335.1 Nramp family divalent metal transporter [Actinomycetota bacterium]